jgi:hypothetical protein
MTDQELNDRFDAISGKLDRVLTRQAESEERDHDMLARLAALERKENAS